jgi:hypothetical protein
LGRNSTGLTYQEADSCRRTTRSSSTPFS